MQLKQLIKEAQACTACAEHLELGCRPLFQISRKAKVLIIGQAPGKAAHESGIPWDDRSGKRLRTWLGVSDEQFYDADQIALVPMGMCYPGKGKSGDLQPRPECAPLWHERMLSVLDEVELTIYVGRYASDRYVSDEFSTLTQAVEGCGQLMPVRVVLPHPSPRNNIWIRKNPWFQDRVVPAVQARVKRILD